MSPIAWVVQFMTSRPDQTPGITLALVVINIFHATKHSQDLKLHLLGQIEQMNTKVKSYNCRLMS